MISDRIRTVVILLFFLVAALGLLSGNFNFVIYTLGMLFVFLGVIGLVKALIFGNFQTFLIPTIYLVSAFFSLTQIVWWPLVIGYLSALLLQIPGLGLFGIDGKQVISHQKSQGATTSLPLKVDSTSSPIQEGSIHITLFQRYISTIFRIFQAVQNKFLGVVLLLLVAYLVALIDLAYGFGLGVYSLGLVVIVLMLAKYLYFQTD